MKSAERLAEAVNDVIDSFAVDSDISDEAYYRMLQLVGSQIAATLAARLVEVQRVKP